LTHILGPAVALLLLDGHARGIYPPPQRVGALELGTPPELLRCLTQWKSLSRDRKVGHSSMKPLVTSPQ
jgi:hypothetical protein